MGPGTGGHRQRQQSDPVSSGALTCTFATNAAAEEKGLLDQGKELFWTGVNFAHGLWNGATTPENWTLSNAWNLYNSASHGFMNGAAFMGSLAYYSNYGIYTGQSLGDIHARYAGRAVDTLFEHTVGLPDLSGEWSQAAHAIGETLMPGRVSAAASGQLINALRLTEAVGAGASVGRIGIGYGAVPTAIPNTRPSPLSLAVNTP